MKTSPPLEQTDLPPSMLPLSVSGYFPHRGNHTANIYKRRSCGNGSQVANTTNVITGAGIQHQQQSALYSNKRRIYQQREAQSCDDLLSSASNLRQTGQKPNVLISGGTGKSEYALNEASFYARVSLDRLREVKQNKLQPPREQGPYPPPPEQFAGCNRNFSDIQKSKSFHRIQPSACGVPPPGTFHYSERTTQPYSAASLGKPLTLTSRNNDDSRLGQADSNPYMAHIYPKNFTNSSAQSVTPHQQRESLYQMIQPPPPPQQPQLIVTQSSNSPAVDPSTSGSNRTSTTFSEEAVTRFGETEESGSEQM